jgi:hypothetical protein
MALLWLRGIRLLVLEAWVQKTAWMTYGELSSAANSSSLQSQQQQQQQNLL